MINKMHCKISINTEICSTRCAFILLTSLWPVINLAEEMHAAAGKGRCGGAGDSSFGIRFTLQNDYRRISVGEHDPVCQHPEMFTCPQIKNPVIFDEGLYLLNNF